MGNHLQIITNCVDLAGDYFSQLGGSGRYEGFMHWHIPAMVFLILINEDGGDLIPRSMWEKTDQLPNRIKARLQGSTYSADDISQFIQIMSTKINKIGDEREIKGWMGFLSQIKTP